MQHTVRRLTAVVLAALVATAAALAQQQTFKYPETRTVDHVDTYHGVKVPDPYRWLEDDTSAETAAWVEAQNKVTFGYLEKIPYRKALVDRVLALNNYEKYSSPSRMSTMPSRRLSPLRASRSVNRT